MPEGPEVKIITEQLNDKISNKKLLKVEILGGRYQKNGPPENYEDFVKNLPLQISQVNCKGKFIWFSLEKDWSIWNTLSMSGGWSMTPAKHSDVKFVFDDFSIWFTDQRHFGTFKFCSKCDELDSKLNSIGPDLLSDKSILCQNFVNKIKKYPKYALPKILMEQKIFSGIGNYLKAEILYLSKISPYRKILDITDQELETLFTNTITTINNSYKARGATIRNYSDIDNNSGEFTFKFQVYNRKFDSNGFTVLREKTNDGRTTHWVKEIQV